MRSKSKRKTISAYFIALVTLTIGAIISVKQNDWMWFSRCGSLVVVIGILLTSSQIIDHMQRLKQRQLKWQGEFHRDWAKEEKQQSMLDSRFNEEITWSNEKSGFYMLIVGTLIWGFGDLLNILN